jgi:hypothetical protein
MGAGYLGFSFLLPLYVDDTVWFDFWEEATELLLMVAVGSTLTLFRQGVLMQDGFLRSRVARAQATK